MAISKATTSIRVDEDLFEKIKIIAEKERRSLNAQIEVSIERYIVEYEKTHGIIFCPN